MTFMELNETAQQLLPKQSTAKQFSSIKDAMLTANEASESRKRKAAAQEGSTSTAASVGQCGQRTQESCGHWARPKLRELLEIFLLTVLHPISIQRMLPSVPRGNALFKSCCEGCTSTALIQHTTGSKQAKLVNDCVKIYWEQSIFVNLKDSSFVRDVKRCCKITARTRTKVSNINVESTTEAFCKIVVSESNKRCKEQVQNVMQALRLQLHKWKSFVKREYWQHRATGNHRG